MAIATSPADIAALKTSGHILADTLRTVARLVKPGVTTLELDAVAEKKVRSAGAIPSFLGYQGYPASLCVSVNDEVVHGIPGERALKTGDVIGLDFGVIYDGWFTDAAITVTVGKVSSEVKEFLAVTQQALAAAIAVARVDNRIGDIGAAVEAVVNPHGYGIVQQLCGHGVGRAVHEPPQIPNWENLAPGRSSGRAPSWQLSRCWPSAARLLRRRLTVGRWPRQTIRWPPILSTPYLSPPTAHLF